MRTSGAPPRGVEPRWVPVAIFAGLLLIYASTVTTGVAVNDVSSADIANWRLAATGHPWLDGVRLAALPHLTGSRTIWLTRSAGHLVIARSPGVMVAAVPAYLIARATVDPHSFSLVPGALTAAVLTAGTMTMLYLSLEGLVPLRWRAGAVLVVALTTPVWSVAADGLWTHTLTCFGVAGMAWSARRERWWLLGLFGGIGLWGRLHVALIVAVLGVGLAITRRRPGIAIAVGSTSGALLVLASLWSHALYGGWSPSGAYAGPVSYATGAAGASHVGQVLNELWLLISPNRGMLVWTPALVVLANAMRRAWRSTPDWMRLLALGGVAYLFVQGLLNQFAGGQAFFGYRLTLETLLCLSPLAAVSAAGAGRRTRRLLGPVLGLQAGTFALGSIANLQPGGLNWYDCPLVTIAVKAPILFVLLGGCATIGIAVQRVIERHGGEKGPRGAQPQRAATIASDPASTVTS